MNRTIHRCLAASLFAAALIAAPACDKGGDQKDAKVEDKAEKAEAAKPEAAEPEPEPEPAGHAGGEAEASASATVDAGARVDIEVDAGGYHPAEITAPGKSKITLAFKRTSEAGCGSELVIADMDVKKDLPVGETVEIEVEVPESGELGFACGMDMYKGKVVARES